MLKGLVLRDLGQIVENQHIEVIEPGERRFEREFAASDLQALHEIGSPREQHPPSLLDEGQADGRRQMRLSSARRSNYILPANSSQSLFAFITPITRAPVLRSR